METVPDKLGHKVFMKIFQKITVSAISFFFLLLFFVSTNSVLAVVCDDPGTKNKCGSVAGCGTGEMCTQTFNARPFCEANEYCANADHSDGITCSDWSSDGKCGGSGGCAQGYRCSNGWTTSPVCVQDSVNCGPGGGDAGNGGQLSPMICGGITADSLRSCTCPNSPSGNALANLNNGSYCCGWASGTSCYSSLDEYNAATGVSPTPSPTSPSTPGGGGSGTETPPGGTGGASSDIDIFEGPTSTNFKQLNPLEMFGNSEGKALTSPGAIVSRLLVFAFPLAGLILFTMLVWGGFEMLTGATSKGIDAGKQRVTSALVGFLLLFVSYWVFQIVEVIFGVAIL